VRVRARCARVAPDMQHLGANARLQSAMSDAYIKASSDSTDAMHPSKVMTEAISHGASRRRRLRRGKM
jgi:hypothetical protein